MKSKRFKVLVGLTLGALAFTVQAAPITVQNPSFESLDTVFYLPGSLTNWSGTGDHGVFQPNTYPASGAGFIAGVFETQTAYINPAGSISQTLGSTLAAGTYTLRVNVGDRADSAAPVYAIALLEGANLLSSIGQTNFTPPNDGWIETTLTYVSPGSGSNLIIRLSGTDGGQVNFDNVRLDFVAAVAQAPEPGTLALLGLGLAGLAASRRRKQ